MLTGSYPLSAWLSKTKRQYLGDLERMILLDRFESIPLVVVVLDMTQHALLGQLQHFRSVF